MDLSKLKIVHDLHNYEQLTAVLKSKPDYRNILINEINVDFLYSIALWEYKYYKKHGNNGAAVIILHGMLRMPPSKCWSMLGSRFVTIFEKWLQFVIDPLIYDEYWWKFLKVIMDIVENLCIKDNLIKLLVVEKLTKPLLKLVINDKVIINKKILILRCLNKCSYQCGQQVKQYMSKGLMQYFIKMSKFMSTCGHMDMQLKLFETLMSWLLIRNDLKGRSLVASLLFTPDFYSESTIAKFISSDFHNFAKDAAEWLNLHNSYTGHVLTLIYKKFVVGNTVLTKQPSRLHLNLGAKCLTVPLGQKLLTNCSLPYSEILTVSVDNTQSVEFVTGHQLAINICTIDGPEFLYESTADVIVIENKSIHIDISNRSDIIQVEWALDTLFRGKYKRVNVESTDKLSPTPSGSGYDFFSQSLLQEMENSNITSYGMCTAPAIRISSPEEQQRDNTPTEEENVSLPVQNNGEDINVLGTSSNGEQNSLLFYASTISDNNIEESLPDIDENLIENIIIDALNINHAEVPTQPQVPTSPKVVEEIKELVVTKSTSVDEGSSEAISDTPQAGFVNIRRKRLSVVKTYTSFKKQRTEQSNESDIIYNTTSQNGDQKLVHCGSLLKRKQRREIEIDKEASKDNTNKESGVISNKPTQNGDQVLVDSGSCPPKRKKITEEIDKEASKYTNNKDDKKSGAFNNTPTQNGDQVLVDSESCPPKRKKITEEIDEEAGKVITKKGNKHVTSLTRKKRKLYSPKDEAEFCNQIAVEDVDCEPNAFIGDLAIVNDMDNAFDRLRMSPIYTDKNREDDVTSIHSMQLRPRSTKVFNFSSDEWEDDYIITNKFASRIRKKSTDSSLKSVKKSAKKPKTNVKKPRQTKKTRKPKTTKINYTIMDERARKSDKEVLDTSITNVPTYNDELMEPPPKLRHIYPEVTVVNPEENLNNSFTSLRSLNIEVEKPNMNKRSSESFVTNVKKILKTADTKATTTLQTNIVSSPPLVIVEVYDAEQQQHVQEDNYEHIDYIEFTSPKKPNQIESKEKSEHDINPITSKSHDEIMPLEQVQYSKPNYHTSSQDFQTKKVKKRQSKKSKNREQKAVAKIQKKRQEKNDTGIKPVQESNNNLNDTRSSDDFLTRKPILKLRRLKMCNDLKSVQESNKDVAQKKTHEKNTSEQSGQEPNKSMAKRQEKSQENDDSRCTSGQESNKSMAKRQEKSQEKDYSGLKSGQESNKSMAKRQEKSQEKDYSGLKSGQESNKSMAKRQEKSQEKDYSGLKSGQESNKSMAKRQEKSQEKDYSGLKSGQESNKSMAKRQEKSQEKDYSGLKSGQESNKSMAKRQEKSQEKDYSGLKSGQESNKSMAKRQEKSQEKDYSGLKSGQESNKSMAKRQEKSQEKDYSGFKSGQESNKSITKRQETSQKKYENELLNQSIQESNKSFNDSTYSEDFQRRTPILKLQKLNNIDLKERINKKINTTDCIDKNDVTLTQLTENSQSIRKSRRILEKPRQRKGNAISMTESTQYDNWDTFLDPDSQCINTNGQQPSRSRNTSTSKSTQSRGSQRNYTRRSGQSSQEHPSTSILKGKENLSAQSILVKTILLPSYGGHRCDEGELSTQSSIRSEPSQEEIMILDPAEMSNISEHSLTEDQRETIKKAIEIMKKQNEKFLLDVGKNTQLLLEKFVHECERQKDIIIEKLKTCIINSLEDHTTTFNKLEETLK